MSIKDITKTGPQTWREIKAQNIPLAEEMENAYYQTRALPIQQNIAQVYRNAQNLPILTAYEFDEYAKQLGLGNSKFDKAIGIGDITHLSPETLQNIRADQQSGVAQLAQGLTRLVTTAATTVVDDIAGTLYGVGQGVLNWTTNGWNTYLYQDENGKTYNSRDGYDLVNGNIIDVNGNIVATGGKEISSYNNLMDGFVNNDLSRALHTFNNKMREWMPTYTSSQYEQYREYGKWWRNMGSTAWWADMLENTGFMVGTAIAMTAGPKIPVVGRGINAFGKESLNATRDVIAKAAKVALDEADDVTRQTLRGIKDLSNIPDDVARASKQLHVKNVINTIQGSAVAAIGESRLEALGAGDQIAAKGDLIEQRYQELMQGAQSEVQLEHPEWFDLVEYDGMVVTIPNEQAQAEITRRQSQYTQQRNSALELIANQAKSMSNHVFGWNMAVLTLSNALAFNQFMSPGQQWMRMNTKSVTGESWRNVAKRLEQQGMSKDAVKAEIARLKDAERINKRAIRQGEWKDGKFEKARDLKANWWQTRGKNIGKALGSPIREGVFEEMGQGVAQEAANYSAASKLNEFYGYTFDQDGLDQSVSWINALAEGFNRTYSDSKGWEQGVMGALTAMIPLPMMGFSVSRSKDSQGKKKFNFSMTNEFWQGLTSGEAYKSAQELAKQYNDLYNDPNGMNMAIINALARAEGLNSLYQEAVDNNDMFEMIGINNKKFWNIVTLYNKLGRVSELRNILSEIQNTNAEDLGKQVLDSYKAEELDGYTDESQLDPENIGNKVKENAVEYEKKLDDYLEIEENIYNLYGSAVNGALNEEYLTELSFITANIKSLEQRWQGIINSSHKALETIIKGLDNSPNLTDGQKQKLKKVWSILMQPYESESISALSVVLQQLNDKELNDAITQIQELNKDFKYDDSLTKAFRDIHDLQDILVNRAKYIDKFKVLITNPQAFINATNQSVAQFESTEARNIAKKINWKGDNAEILRDYNTNKADIDKIGEETFLKNLTDEEREALRRARQDSKIDNSFKASVDDSPLFAANKRKIKDAYDNSELKTPEERIRQIKENIEEILAERKEDGSEFTRDERDSLTQQIELALQALTNFEGEVQEYREHIHKDIESEAASKEAEVSKREEEGSFRYPTEEEENIKGFNEEELEVIPSNVEKYNRNAKRKRGHNRSVSNIELGRPQLTEFALEGIDNETYLDYLNEYPEAIPEFTDQSTEEDYKTYIEAVHTHLKEQGAFDYVKHHLKVGDKLEFFIDESLNEKAKQTVVLIRVADTNQVIGSLPATIDFNSRTKTASEFNEEKPTQWETSKQTLAERNPSRFKQYQDIISKYNEDKKNGVDTTDKVYDTSTVEKLLAGDLSLSSREKTVQEVFDEAKSQPVIGVVTVDDNGQTVVKYSQEKIKSFRLEGRQAGQVYAFIPSNNGIFVPALLWSTPLNEIIGKGMDDPYIKDLVEQLQRFTSISRDERTHYVGQLQKALRTPHGFTLRLVKYEKGKSIPVDLIEEATHINIQLNRGRKDEENRIKKSNPPITIKLDENKELSDDNVLKALKEIIGRFKGDKNITTGVNIDRLSNPEYVTMISDYLNFNVNQAHTINDWFTYKLAVDKGKEVDEDANKAEHNNTQERRIEINEGKKVTILPNGEPIVDDDEDENLYSEPEKTLSTSSEDIENNVQTPTKQKLNIDNTIPRFDIDQEEQLAKEQSAKEATNEPLSRNIFGGNTLTNTRSFETIGGPATRRDDKFFTSEQEEEPVSETYLYQDIARLKTLLPDLNSAEHIVIVDNMIESIDREGNPIQVYAKYSNGVLYIKRESPKGVAYHESFHYVVDWLLSKQDKTALFNEAFARYNTSDTVEAEEKLAEDFRKFMIGMYDKTLRGGLRRLFIKLKALINKVFNNRDGIDILFWDIYSNRFSKKIQEGNLYDNKLKSYNDKKYAYENLDEDTKEYMQARHFSKENYDKLSLKQKEYLLHCM